MKLSPEILAKVRAAITEAGETDSNDYLHEQLHEVAVDRAEDILRQHCPEIEHIEDLAAIARGMTRQDIVVVQITRRFKQARRSLRRVASRREVLAYQSGQQDWITTMHGNDASVWDYQRGIFSLKILAS
jgi:SepF-like predicted cell division protein (DUF552 family)